MISDLSYFNLLLSNVLRMHILIAIDPAAYLDCSFSHVDLFVVQLCTALRGLSPRPKMIMANAFLSIFLLIKLSFSDPASSRNCRAATTLSFSAWKSSFCYPLNVGNLASYFLSPLFVTTLLMVRTSNRSSNKFFHIKIEVLSCNVLQNAHQLSCNFESSDTQPIRAVYN